MPYAAPATSALAALLEPVAVLTTMLAVVALLRAEGTWTLICAGDTKNSGAATPLNVTEVPARTMGNGVFVAAVADAARYCPHRVTIIWGAITSGSWLDRLAAFCTPPG